MMERSK